MAAPPVDPFVVAGSYDSLVRRIAERDPAALVQLHHLLVRQIFVHVRAGMGHAGAASVTRAIFLEVWRLAPVSKLRQGDAHAWLLAIAGRRVAEHLRARGEQLSWVPDYDQHLGMELNALLRHGRPARRTGTNDL